MPRKTPRKDDGDGTLDVVVVGAGPAGLGVAAALKALGIECRILDRHAVGATFERWPEGMRLLTPSFNGNSHGAVDLNAIHPHTSPAFSLGVEHPTGPEYARYLRAAVDYFELDVEAGCDVTRLERKGARLRLQTSRGPRWAQHVVWAAGEAAYPSDPGFPGAAHCARTIEVTRWADVAGEPVVIIGGYESGIDAAVQLVERGRKVIVLDPRAPWVERRGDPSRILSPYTHERLERAQRTGRLDLVDHPVRAVKKRGEGFQVDTPEGPWMTSGPPLLATGFEGSLSLVRDLFAWSGAEPEIPALSEHDESTRTPNLFLAGPLVRHRVGERQKLAIFCFIYKFRARFPVIAAAIADRLGVDDLTPLTPWRERGMWLDDLSCCADDCAC